MKQEQARNFVGETLMRSFDKTRFRNFVLELLNEFDESKAFTSNKTYIKHAFKDHVERFERLGTYTSPDDEKLDVLVVHLAKQSKLSRARTAIRNFVADHLKIRDEKDAALVAFVSPTERQWRFSYVKMEYAAVETEAGRVGIETRLTPARRCSYIVGEGESCHTAQSRFLALLQDTESFPTLAQLEDAFSVEAVTKEFFIQYASLFSEIDAALQKLAAKDKTIGNEFKEKNVSTVDFAKKLMGQIVFLYFLQKKGWLGVAKGQDWGTGPHDFLRRLARGDYGAYDNFFNDVLEPLFYDTLATDRGHEAWCNRFKCRIPFLNGGLFEPLADYDWRKIDIILPDRLFTNSEFVEHGVTGTGILDVFDRCNFTVNEAEPLDKEVAIDPEMLGKVFENLIEENRRKGLGAFYTPRAIVHHKCQECLINYLDTALNTDKETVPRKDIETFIRLGEQISHYEAVDAKYPIKMPATIEKHARLIDEKLATITVCDPAVGSGAYPVGMMTEIVRARCALTSYFNDVHDRTPYHFKRHAIQNCLYGVDIDPGAVEIAKLRLWLSLVVDEEDVKQIKPLPNLDYKIVTGNSLMGFPFKSQRLQQIEKLKSQFFDETDHDSKAKLKRHIDSELTACLAAAKKSYGYEINFDFDLWFSEVFHGKNGFDVIIANPPYVGEKGHKELFTEIKKGGLGGFYLGKVDIFYFFFHLALNIGRPSASIAFITTNYYPTADGARKLRFDFRKRATVKNLINLGELKLFEAALGQHNMITILSKSNNPSVVAQNCITKRNGVVSSEVLQDILQGRDAQTQYFRVPQDDLYDGEENYIRIQGAKGSSGDLSHSVLSKLSASDSLLGNECIVNIGMRTGADKVSQKYIDSYKLNLEKGQGIYVITEEEKNRLHLNQTEEAMLLPFFKNSDIKQYYCETKNDLWLIDLTYPKFRDVKWNSIPHIRDHIWQFEKILKSRRSNDNGLLAVIDSGYWWCYTMRQLDFAGEKIVSPQRSVSNTFALSSSHWVASMDVYFITQDVKTVSLKYVLALLNSRLYYFWLYHRGKRKGEALELYQKPLSEVPMKRIGTDEQKPFIKLVDRIRAAKQRDAEADTSVLEREIDQLVYALYGLTPEEIKIVEGAAK
jgi:type I restriction-modification system DNA methylase subunit